jgi:hypothetical protein
VLTESEYRQHAADWDECDRVEHLLTKVVECGVLIVQGLGTKGYDLTPEQIRPWRKAPPPTALDAQSAQAALAFFGTKFYTLPGPMPDAEKQWADD